MDTSSITSAPCRNCGSTERNYRGDCKECKRIKGRARYARMHPEAGKVKPTLTKEERAAKHRAYMRAYYAKNKQRHKELGAAWAARNQEKVREIKRKWVEANPAAMAAAISDWRRRNAERDAENKRKWNRDNAERKRVLTANRRHRMLGKLSTNIVDVLMERQNGLCACCGADLVASGFHIDHIRPVSKGGLNIDSNVQLLTPTCNLRKNAKWPMS